MSGVITVIHRSEFICVMSTSLPVQLCKPKWPGADQTAAYLRDRLKRHHVYEQPWTSVWHWE